MNSFSTFVAHNWGYILAGSAYFIVAAVETMPKPGDPRPVAEKVYNWFYDFFHVISNKVVERHPNAAPVPSAPGK